MTLELSNKIIALIALGKFHATDCGIMQLIPVLHRRQGTCVTYISRTLLLHTDSVAYLVLQGYCTVTQMSPFPQLIGTLIYFYIFLYQHIQNCFILINLKSVLFKIFHFFNIHVTVIGNKNT